MFFLVIFGVKIACFLLEKVFFGRKLSRKAESNFRFTIYDFWHADDADYKMKKISKNIVSLQKLK